MLALRKIFKILALTILSFFALIVLASLIISAFYEQTMISYMKKYLDDHLLTELSMGEVRFRFLKGFPNATIEITDVVLLSGKDFSPRQFSGNFADTLLQADNIYLQFNILKLLQKEYELKEIEIAHGSVNILFDHLKRHNLQIWKSSGGSEKSYPVHLNSILLNKCSIRINYLPGQFSLEAFSDKTNFKGTFADNILSGEVKGTLNIRKVKSGNKILLQNASFVPWIDLIYNKERFEIRKGKFQLNKATGNITGILENKKERTIDMTVNMPKFGLDELMSVLPGLTKFTQRHYNFSGSGKLYLVVKGSLSNRKYLLVKSGFELRDGTARNTKTRSSVTGLKIKGSVTGNNELNFTLVLDDFSARLGKGELSGSFTLNNLKTLAFNADLHALLDLKALKEFAEIDTIEDMKGMVLSEFRGAGSLSRLSDSSATVVDMIESGRIVFHDASLSFKNLPIKIEQVNGKAFWNNTIRIDSMALKINETEIMASGEISNLSNYLQEKGLLQARLTMVTDKLDLSKYVNKPSDNKSSSGYKSLSIIPSNIYLEAALQAKEFITGKFEANDLSVNLSALRDSLYINSFSMGFPEGSISGDGLITLNDQHVFSITCNARPLKINIQQLFYACNNFSQHFIKDKNLKGLLGGTMSFYAQWDSTLKLIPSSMKAQGEFQITNGELVQFEPMLKLSKYIDVDELKHIRFKTMKNTIYISDRTVSIPEMAINSTAFNISIAGLHTFDNHFDYRIRVLLSDVLFNKARKKKKEIEEFLIEDNKADQPTIPLVIAGTPNDFTVKFDRKKALNLTRTKVKGEDEIVLHKPAPNNFKVEWEEPVKTEEKKAAEEKSKSSDFEIEWDE
jgi:hypothetical protein